MIISSIHCGNCMSSIYHMNLCPFLENLLVGCVNNVPFALRNMYLQNSPHSLQFVVKLVKLWFKIWIDIYTPLYYI